MIARLEPGLQPPLVPHRQPPYLGGCLFLGRASGLLQSGMLVLLGMMTFTAQALELETPHYRVRITPQCEEGEISCDRVDYLGMHKENGSAIALRGRTHHTLCADGVTPCRFLGYVFRRGNTIYWVGEDGTLRVTAGKRLLLEERGEWVD